jgi:hypothetical protein
MMDSKLAKSDVDLKIDAHAASMDVLIYEIDLYKAEVFAEEVRFNCYSKYLKPT